MNSEFLVLTRRSQESLHDPHLEWNISHCLRQVVGFEAVPVVQMFSNKNEFFHGDCRLEYRKYILSLTNIRGGSRGAYPPLPYPGYDQWLSNTTSVYVRSPVSYAIP